MIDSIDRTILTMLQANARVANSEIAKEVGMAPSAVLERVRKLEAQGIIKGYTVTLDSRQLDYGLVAFVFVRTEDSIGEVKTAKLLASIPEVQEVHHVAGEDCFLVKVRSKDTNHLSEILRERFGKIKTLRSTRTTIVLDTVKEISTLFLDINEKEK